MNDRITGCRRCPRLVKYRRGIAAVKRKAYFDQEYWGRPVPNLGRSRVPLLIVGLAPGAHGANRTGRMFTGDRSGDWLFAAMHEAGFCNQPTSKSADDGLRLVGCAITAVCHCAPPDNKPLASEIENCQYFFEQAVQICRPKVFLALGGLAWNAIVNHAVDQNWIEGKKPKFGHATVAGLHRPGKEQAWLVGSYHPSQQNTFTGKLTRPMFDDVFARVNKLIGR